MLNHFNLFENNTEPNENAFIKIREMKRRMIKAWRIKNPFGKVKLKIQFHFFTFKWIVCQFPNLSVIIWIFSLVKKILNLKMICLYHLYELTDTNIFVLYNESVTFLLFIKNEMNRNLSCIVGIYRRGIILHKNF